MKLAVGALAMCAGVGIAAADPAPATAPVSVPVGAPDPDVIAAADEANLVSTASRQGLTFAAAIGGALTLGVGVHDAVGRGGAFSLRVGHVATPSTVITFEVTGGGFLHQTGMSADALNSAVDILAGAQVYTSPSLWLRIAGGGGTFSRNDNPGDPARVSGLAAAAGAGIDIAKLRWFTLDVEIFAAGLLAGGGLVTTSALCLGGAIY